MTYRALQILWPAFLVAGVIEMLLFASIEPREVRWFGFLLGWEPVAIHSVVFLLLWLLVSGAAAMTVLLQQTAEEPDPPPGSAPRF